VSALVVYPTRGYLSDPYRPGRSTGAAAMAIGLIVAWLGGAAAPRPVDERRRCRCACSSPDRPCPTRDLGRSLGIELYHRLWAGNEDYLASVSAALEQLVGTSSLDQRYARRHHRLELAGDQPIEERRERLAVPGGAGIRGR
jgi:hypothetical protein